jgi:squalene cyclase
MTAIATPVLGPAIDAAIGRGVAFLTEDLAHGPDGLWRDYRRPDGSGGSNVWASGFIAAHVGRIPAAQPMAAAVVARLVEGRRGSGGWAYDQSLLEDCDSTAWVLLAAKASATPLPRSVVIPSVRFILRHQHEAGGFVTYGPEGIQLFGEIAEREGWFTPQPCVTAASLAALAAYASPELPALVQACRYLAQTAAGGLWQAYWWYGPTYATYHAVRALAQVQQLSPHAAEATIAALLRTRGEDGGWDGEHPARSLPFPTALAFLTLLELDWVGPELAAAAEFLLAHQQADGSFVASAELLVPGGTSAEPMTMLDQGRFTSACVLHALHDYRRWLSAAGRE